MLKNILISVWDKKELDKLVSILNKSVTIFSTGGTYKYLQNNTDLKLKKIEDYTGNKEIFNGRVKTLDYKIYASILLKNREDDQSLSLMKKLDIVPMDMVVINLYPFKEFLLNNRNVEQEKWIEMIDIGGVSLLRAAAKNFRYVIPLPSVEFYELFSLEYKKHKKISNKIRMKLAFETFKITSKYDQYIMETFSEVL